MFASLLSQGCKHVIGQVKFNEWALAYVLTIYVTGSPTLMKVLSK